MDIQAVWAVLLTMPQINVVLVVILSVAACVLIQQILETGPYLPFFAFPLFFCSGLIGHAAFLTNGVTLSPDKASDIVIGASAGLMVFIIVALLFYRVWAHFRDKVSKKKPAMRTDPRPRRI